MNERSTAIIVTFPVKFLIDLGFSYFEGRTGVGCKQDYTKKRLIRVGFNECIRQIEALKSNPEMYWLHSMGNKPVDTDSILHCYINILGKIRYRAKVIEFQSAPKGQVLEQTFDDGRKWTGKHWLLIHEFEKLKPEIKMGGFQGFRYWKDDYDG